jgi:DNA polymerase-2
LARRHFPDLDYYDADIPLAVRVAAEQGLFPLAHCRVTAGEDGQVRRVDPLDSRWDLDPPAPPLRVLELEPDVNPFHARPSRLVTRFQGTALALPLAPFRALAVRLQARLRRHDPDVIITNWGDTWLFPRLLAACRQRGITYFNPNRDRQRQVIQRRENSYFTYGQVVYRGNQVHLFGRWHIDQQNAMMFGQYGLDGVLEQARVSGLPVQEVARKSPGAGITAMQMQVALREGILVPYQKQQVERFKTARDLIRADRGGLVYQPLIGLHRDVAEIDFVSMYPSIMVHFNISPETVGQSGEGGQPAPEIGIPVDQTRPGLVPKTLRPLLTKRIAIKNRLSTMSRRDYRYSALKARSNALKWLLVVCFGYLGYKNARFGRIESHEAVTAFGREALLRAKEAAEDLGFTVLHMYVDGLWIKRPGSRRPADFQALLEEVAARTGLPIGLEGVYRWIAFLPSRLDGRVPVANRYFGVFEDGLFKARGIEVRRHDTAPFVAQVQLLLLERMARVPDNHPLEACLPDVMARLSTELARLREGQVPIEQLVVAQKLSRALEEYRVPSPAARAAAQLATAGKTVRPGQPVRFIYTLGEPGVWAWDRPGEPPVDGVDRARYADLLIRAAAAVLQPLGVQEQRLREQLNGGAYQEAFAFTAGCPAAFTGL